jgi:hypothetical protein
MSFLEKRQRLAESSPCTYLIFTLEDIILSQFSFHSKPGSPSKETEDGVRTSSARTEEKIIIYVSTCVELERSSGASERHGLPDNTAELKLGLLSA